MKLTDIGEIPEDWDIHNIGNISPKVGSGKTPKGGVRVYKNQGRHFVRSQNVGWGNLILDDIAYIDEQTHNSFNSTEIHEGDVLLNITGASIGRSAIATKIIAHGNVNQHVCLIRLNKDHNEPGYLNHFLLSTHGQKQISDFQTGGNRQGLNFTQIKSIKIPLPPTKAEQTAIANVLSDADALIISVENLIAKKKVIKQGAMQELLRPKLGWRNRTLIDVTTMKSGDTITSESITIDGIYPCYGGNGLRGYTTKFTHNGDYVLIGRQGALCGNVQLVHGTFYASEHAIVVTPNFEINIKWLYYVLERMNLNQYSESSAQPGLSVAKILNLDIQLPPTKEEQIRSAQIFSDMDAEISLLEKKLEKQKRIKQGMMQVLLTGKIRLV
jgi:type I restriction enzyme S subunit